ncbi:MAG: PqqD family protein [Candidatus Glassbacteria bacterium]
MKRGEVNLLSLIPVRNRDWESRDGSSVVILAPRFTNRWLLEKVVPRLKNPYYKVSLDEVGSRVWMSCDGKKTVGEIAKRLRDEFGEDVEPVYDRLGSFFKTMEEHLFIRFKNI